jgi:hypothetical protein
MLGWTWSLVQGLALARTSVPRLLQVQALTLLPKASALVMAWAPKLFLAQELTLARAPAPVLLLAQELTQARA